MTEILLAKSSGETLSEHTIACLKAAKSLLDSLPIPQSRRHVIEQDVLLAVAMHDVGKAATGFQKVLRGEQDDWHGKRHEIISASFATCIAGVSPSIIFAILTHHKCIPSDGIGQIFGCLPYEQIPIGRRQTIVWNEMAQEWKDNCTLFLDEWKRILEYVGQDSLLSYCELKPLLLSASWFDRTVGKEGQRRSIEFHDRYHASLVRGLTIAADHLGTSHRIPSPVPKFVEFHVLRQGLRPYQERIREVIGSVILRAPTGSGKTEAALLWAQKNQRPNGRLYYVLPYTASINAMHGRLSRIFGHANVGLLHHRATQALYSMLEADTDDTSRLDRQQIAATLSDLARGIWFPVRVCTPHQILRYALRGKGWEYMLAEFPNSCFIFDEVHAYDPRVVGLTLGTAKLFSQWGARCLFLSATLPSFLYELISKTMGNLPFVQPAPTQEEDRKLLDKKRHVIEVRDGSIADHIEAVIQSIRDGSSTLIVCNHVRASQELYRKLQARLPGENVRLLHSQFNQQDRNRIEDEIIGGSLPKVLVATQVVEVSLNVDFSQAFLEPAPIDALIQRMGRVNRFGERPPAKVVVFTKQIKPFQLYCDCATQLHRPNCRVFLTINELLNLQNPVGETDLIESADRVYGEGYQGEDRTSFEEGLNHPDVTEFEGRLLAGAYQDWVESVIDKTDGIVDVLPKCLLGEYGERREKGLWIEANSLLVSIRTKSLAWLKPKLDMSSDPWIADFSYTSDIGLEL